MPVMAKNKNGPCWWLYLAYSQATLGFRTECQSIEKLYLYLWYKSLIMGFHINKKVADKKATTGAKATFQGGSSKFIAKASTKSTGTTKKPIKTGGSRGS